ncbi:substrate-binding domain-containing protein [Oceanibium sediminis]|uniref:substrate-binding domain-containing protein n=1 Tax=Oceanibium sediminis TaxID=2026339 RepID=UPI0018E4E09B|nr:substrate-binding domain-containing protein [Oceanibium sediminis]
MKKIALISASVIALSCGAASAQDDVFIMEGVSPHPELKTTVEAGAFTAEAPWTIGMSHFGVNANTWTVQVSHEARAAAAADERIEELIILDAGFDQAKQVADIEDLIAQGVDALIVMPVTTTSANASIERAIAAGIPVVLHTGRIDSDAFTTEIQGGAEHFGAVMAEWLVEQTGGKGNIWVLRGLAGHPEDTNRYKGAIEAFEGTELTITAEQHGDWQYDQARNLCETLYLSNPDVDGIWSSGADMTRACVDVFKQFGAEIPPITGEGNNGYFGQWIEDGFASISSEYSPAQGAAGIRAATALLGGEPLYKHYVYRPAGWDVERAAEYYRDDLSANVWWPSELPEEKLVEIYGK